MQIGDKILIRTYSAGVHFGTLAERNGQEVRLTKARRLWSWTGTLSLSEVAMIGPNVGGSKISEPVDEILILQAIEIISIAKKSTITALCN